MFNSIKEKPLAEQFKTIAKISRQKLEEEAKIGSPKDLKKAQNLYQKILKEIKTESEKGNTNLFWSNHYMWFGRWTVSFSLASAICNLLENDGFSTSKCLSSSDIGQYYISIYW
jgi:hypothetical protein